MAWFSGLFGGSGGAGGHDMVGQYVEMGQQRLRIKKVLGEGGYGFVFAAQDTTTGKDYALKRLFSSDESSKKAIMNEVQILRKLRGHSNIVQFVAAASGDSQAGRNEYLILTELCAGQLLELVKSVGGRGLSVEQVLKIFAQTCRAVAHMHKETPAIIHRDLKIENLLINTKGMIKLCDFGSSTTSALYPDDTWTAIQRSLAEDEIQVNTTPMYRSPEMIDLYSNFPITYKADVWALGCLLYTLCFGVHPFEDSAKLKIINANYTIPESDIIFTDFHPLIRSMLQVDPKQRPDVEDIYAELVSIAADKKVDLKSSIIDNLSSATSPTSTERDPTLCERSEGTPVQGASSVLLGNMVNKAGSLFSNLKDASSKMIHSVAGYVNQDLDLCYITSRLLVMSFPADGIEATYKNNIDDVRVYLDTKHPSNYVVVNISERTYRTDKLNDRVFECGWNSKRAPPLDKLVSLCRKLNNFLRQNKNNVVLVHCLDGKVSSSLLMCSFFLFCKLFTKLSQCERLFNLKRCGEGVSVDLSPSQRRYINYMGEIVGKERYQPHSDVLFLKSLSLSKAPLFNKARTGCRPFVEIYENGKRILNTAQEIEQMREYTIEEGQVLFQTHVRMCGDVTIHVHHGRSTLGGKVQGKLTSINIFTLQFHTGFLRKENTHVTFNIDELDVAAINNDRFSRDFAVGMNLKFPTEEIATSQIPPWQKINVDKLTPFVCFASKEEYWLLHEEFGLSEEKSPLSGRSSSTSSDTPTSPRPSDLPTLHQVGKSTFFSSSAETTPDTPKEGAAAGFLIDTDGEKAEKPTSEQATTSLAQTTESLIDIGSAPKESFMKPDLITTSAADPFQELSQTRSEAKPAANSLLLNFDNSHSQLDFDLVSTAKQPVKREDPDLIQQANDNDFFSNFAPVSVSGHPPPQPKSQQQDLFATSPQFNDPFASSQTTDNIFMSTTNQSKHPVVDNLASQHTPSKSHSESNLFDILGTQNMHHTGDTLKPTVPTMNHASSSGDIIDNNKKDKNDLFDFDFGDLRGQGKVTTTFGTSSTTNSSAAFGGGTGQNSRQHPVARTSNPSSGRNSPMTTANKPQAATNKPQPTRPNYNVFMGGAHDSQGGVFGGKHNGGTQPGWAPKPAVNENTFSDILNAHHGFKSTAGTGQSGPTTLKQLRNQQDVDNEVDPIKIKIREWSDGKERNIRALITSLPQVLWEGAKFTPIPMQDLMNPEDIKKKYRRVCLAIHPDKHTGQPHEDLARAIFIEMNDAYTRFEETGSKPLF